MIDIETLRPYRVPIALGFFFLLFWTTSSCERRKLTAKAFKHLMEVCPKKHPVETCYAFHNRNYDTCYDLTIWGGGRFRGPRAIDVGAYVECVYDPKAYKEKINPNRRKRRKKPDKR
jgi:hypothetical protein